VIKNDDCLIRVLLGIPNLPPKRKDFDFRIRVLLGIPNLPPKRKDFDFRIRVLLGIPNLPPKRKDFAFRIRLLLGIPNLPPKRKIPFLPLTTKADLDLKMCEHRGITTKKNLNVDKAFLVEKEGA
jgi:hypothetical protein